MQTNRRMAYHLFRNWFNWLNKKMKIQISWTMIQRLKIARKAALNCEIFLLPTLLLMMARPICHLYISVAYIGGYCWLKSEMSQVQNSLAAIIHYFFKIKSWIYPLAIRVMCWVHANFCITERIFSLLFKVEGLNSSTSRGF